MNALEELHELLRQLPWSERCRLAIREEAKGRKGWCLRGLSLQRGAMDAWVGLRHDGRLVVSYETALHTPAYFILPPAEALHLLLAVLHREQLHPIPGYEAPREPAEEDE